MTKDILCKVWLRRGSDGILARKLCGGRIVEQLPTEMPQVWNRQADLLVRNEAGEVHHVEFQASNDPDFGFRMLEYWVLLRRQYGQAVIQSVFYIGWEPMRLQPRYEEHRTAHEFVIVNLRDYTAEELLASPDWGDNLWALGAVGDPPVVLRAVIERLIRLPREAREPALAELAALSGILKLDELLEDRLKEFPMLDIDLKDNAVIRPLIERGRREGQQQLLLELLQEKFGPLPAWVSARLREGSAEDLDRWAKRVLRSISLESTLE